MEHKFENKDLDSLILDYKTLGNWDFSHHLNDNDFLRIINRIVDTRSLSPHEQVYLYYEHSTDQQKYFYVNRIHDLNKSSHILVCQIY